MNLSTELKAHAASVVFSNNSLTGEAKSAALTRHPPESGLNTLVDCSAAAFEHIHRITNHLASGEAKQTLTQFLETLQQHYQELGYSQDAALAAHYAICATLDDILRQHSKHSLHSTIQQNDEAKFLQHFHQSRLEAEKFYSILEHISAQPDKYIDLLELMYLCLRFGYKGQYRNTPFGLQQWALLTDSTYRLIAETRGQPSHTLSPDLTNPPSAILAETSSINKKRYRFYLLTSLIFIFLMFAAGFIFQQTYDATRDTLITQVVATSSKETAP